MPPDRRKLKMALLRAQMMSHAFGRKRSIVRISKTAQKHYLREVEHIRQSIRRNRHMFGALRKVAPRTVKDLLRLSRFGLPTPRSFLKIMFALIVLGGVVGRVFADTIASKLSQDRRRDAGAETKFVQDRFFTKIFGLCKIPNEEDLEKFASEEGRSKIMCLGLLGVTVADFFGLPHTAQEFQNIASVRREGLYKRSVERQFSMTVKQELQFELHQKMVEAIGRLYHERKPDEIEDVMRRFTNPLEIVMKDRLMTITRIGDVSEQRVIPHTIEGRLEHLNFQIETQFQPLFQNLTESYVDLQKKRDDPHASLAKNVLDYIGGSVQRFLEREPKDVRLRIYEKGAQLHNRVLRDLMETMKTLSASYLIENMTFAEPQTPEQTRQILARTMQREVMLAQQPGGRSCGITQNALVTTVYHNEGELPQMTTNDPQLALPVPEPKPEHIHQQLHVLPEPVVSESNYNFMILLAIACPVLAVYYELYAAMQNELETGTDDEIQSHHRDRGVRVRARADLERQLREISLQISTNQNRYSELETQKTVMLTAVLNNEAGKYDMSEKTHEKLVEIKEAQDEIEDVFQTLMDLIETQQILEGRLRVMRTRM